MSALLVVCASLVAGVLALAAWLWTYRPRTSIPGPPTLPLLGNATMFYKLPVMLDRIAELQRRYGDLFRFYAGPKLIIVVTQPEDVQKLMVTSKPRERDPYATFLLSTFMGNGLLVNKGQVWKNHRKFIERGFHMEELEKFIDTFNESGRFLCDKLAKSNGVEIEVTNFLIMTVLRSITQTIFNTKVESLLPDHKKEAEIVAEIAGFASAFSTFLYRPWTAISFLQWMTEPGRALIRFNNYAKYFLNLGLAKAKENISDIDINGRSLMTCLHPEKDVGFFFTEKDVYDEIATLMSAGIETTSDTFGYLLTLLGLHPEWQERAHSELDDVFGTGSDYLRSATTEDLAQLPVIDAIVKETQRLFPTVPFMPYLVTEDTPLAGGQHVAPRGSTVLVSYYLMHRHPQLFPEPHKFDPGRFLEGGSATTRKPYSYIPFGVGPRQCVGARFAFFQMKTVLAMVLRHYRILPGSSRKELEETPLSLAVRPLTGFRVSCVPRAKKTPSLYAI